MQRNKDKNATQNKIYFNCIKRNTNTNVIIHKNMFIKTKGIRIRQYVKLQYFFEDDCVSVHDNIHLITCNIYNYKVCVIIYFLLFCVVSCPYVIFSHANLQKNVVQGVHKLYRYNFQSLSKFYFLRYFHLIWFIEKNASSFFFFNRYFWK